MSGIGIDALRTHLHFLARSESRRSTNAGFRLVADRRFALAGAAHGRVRAMIDDLGNTVTEAPPSMPVQVLGLTSVPGAGDNFLVVEDDRMARQIADKREARQRAALLARTTRRKTLDQLFEQLEKGETQELKLILKGDSADSVEALEDSLLKIDVGDEVQLRIIHRGVGAITQNDVNLATVDKAVIIGFNVRPNRQVADLAEREGVEIKYYSIIYKAIEDIEASLKGMLKPIFEEVQLGSAEIRQVFRSGKFGNIAGSRVVVRDRPFRVRAATITPENVSVTGDDDLTNGDVQAVLSGRTYGWVQTANAGLTYREVQLKGRRY